MRRHYRVPVAKASAIQRGERLGFYGFGAAAHVAIQVARHWGVEVYAATRDLRHQQLALELGATWAGGTFHCGCSRRRNRTSRVKGASQSWNAGVRRHSYERDSVF